MSGLSSNISRIADSAALLRGRERSLFDDYIVEGLTREQVCIKHSLTPEQFDQTHRSMVRSLCGVPCGRPVLEGA